MAEDIKTGASVSNDFIVPSNFDSNLDGIVDGSGIEFNSMPLLPEHSIIATFDCDCCERSYVNARVPFYIEEKPVCQKCVEDFLATFVAELDAFKLAKKIAKQEEELNDG